MISVEKSYSLVKITISKRENEPQISLDDYGSIQELVSETTKLQLEKPSTYPSIVYPPRTPPSLPPHPSPSPPHRPPSEPVADAAKWSIFDTITMISFVVLTVAAFFSVAICWSRDQYHREKTGAGPETKQLLLSKTNYQSRMPPSKTRTTPSTGNANHVVYASMVVNNNGQGNRFAPVLSKR